MASDNPKGGERAIPLSIPPKQAEWLRDRLSAFIADLEADLQKFPEHPRVGHWRADTDAYGRLINGLNTGSIVPDAQVRRLVCEWAEADDRALRYERVLFEHEALHTLRAQIGAGR